MKPEGQKYQKTIKNLKNAHYKFLMWGKETAQPIRDKSYPHIPSKPLITTIRAAMSR